jgi:predicted RNA-binding protein with PUA-like domain
MYGSSRMKVPNKKQPVKKKTKKGEISEANMKKLKEHSKKHENGMKGIHMRNMIKFMKQGDSFSVAHNKAVKLDKEKSKK